MDINIAFLVSAYSRSSGSSLGYTASLLGPRPFLPLGKTRRTSSAAFGIVQIAISVPLGGSPLLSDFDSGLLFQACAMAMVCLGPEPDLRIQRPVQPRTVGLLWHRRLHGGGHHLSLDQWRCARGLLVVGVGVTLGALMILGIWQLPEKTVPGSAGALGFYPLLAGKRCGRLYRRQGRPLG